MANIPLQKMVITEELVWSSRIIPKTLRKIMNETTKALLLLVAACCCLLLKARLSNYNKLQKLFFCFLGNPPVMMQCPMIIMSI